MELETKEIIMDTDTQQKNKPTTISFVDRKNPPVLSASKKDDKPINEKPVYPGMKSLPLTVISKKPDVPKLTAVKPVAVTPEIINIKKEETTASPEKSISATDDNVKIKKEEPTQTTQKIETPDSSEILPKKEFIVPKKPEKQNIVGASMGGEDLSQKSSVDLSKKSVGWKTLTPTVNIESEELLKKTQNIIPPTKNRPGITNLNTGSVVKEKVPTSSAEDVSALPTIRTYKKDVAGTIRGQKTSLVRMVLEEQKARSKRELYESPQSKKNLPLIFFSIIFFCLTVGVTYYAFFRPTTKITEFTELNTVPLIGTEYNQEISITGQTTREISDAISKELGNTNLRLDTIEYVYFTEKYMIPTDKGEVESKKILEINKLFDVLLIPVPQNFLRSIKSDYMFGFHNFNKNQPFLILKTDYYSATFAGMLGWERTMLTNLFPLFGITQAEDLKDRTWIDVVSKNKDIRELKDFNNQNVLVYMFKDLNTLILTTNENTLFEVARRLDLIKEKK